MKTILSLLSFVSIVSIAGAAGADTPPASDKKRVPYTFTVHGVAAAPADVVLFAYPCSGSGGAPTDTATRLQEGLSLPVGRHERCSLYMTTKARFDAWATQPGPASSWAQSSTACTGGPSPLHELDDSDSRNALNEDLDVKVDGASCSVTSRNPPSASAGGCNAAGASTSLSVALLVGLPALLALLGRRRAAVR